MFRRTIALMSGYTPGEQPPRASKVIKLNTNENPYPPSPRVAEAIRGVLDAGLQRYPDPHATAFRIQAADLLGLEPDWILCGNGSDDILTIITRTFVESGQVIRFAAPSYVLYDTLASIQGAMADVVRYEPDWSLGFRFAQTVEGLRLAILANPNSPSGTTLPPGEVAAIADALPCPLLIDEAYVDFAETSCVDLVRTNERILVSRSLSKSYALAGLRFGYVVAQPQVIEQLNKVKDSYNCDALSIAGATAAVADQDWLQANVARIAATRSRLSDALQQMGFDLTESQANFAWATHPKASHEELYLSLKSQGVLVRYMRFARWGDGLRISVGTDDQVDALLRLMRELI